MQAPECAPFCLRVLVIHWTHPAAQLCKVQHHRVEARMHVADVKPGSQFGKELFEI